MTSLADLFPSIGFLGAGNMAGALLRGTVGRGLLEPRGVWACDVVEEKLKALGEELSIQTTGEAGAMLREVETVVLALKPQGLVETLKELADQFSARHRVISIVAGVTSGTIAGCLPAGVRIVRVMPNTPALVGAGASGVAAGPNATPGDLQASLALFEAVGIAVEVEESQLDAVTALSGSGPAYVFRLMEAMEQAGVELGLALQVARKLTLQTFLGASRLAIESDEEPGELRRRVTSPGGTTAAALDVFEQQGLAEVLAAGMTRARDRSIELSRS